MKKIIIFIGPPGSGKGTQAKLIAKKYNYHHISTGDLLRALLGDQNADPREKQAAEPARRGEMVPDWLIYRLVFEDVSKHMTTGRGVVLDGAIRNLEQAKEYEKFFEEKQIADQVMTVEVKLDDGESHARLTKRRMCKKCEAIIPWLPVTRDITVCPHCGGELAARPDDTPEVIKERIKKQGNEALKPILEYYRKLGELRVVDGMGSIEEVERQIEDIISKS